jgi:hypothetical protein
MRLVKLNYFNFYALYVLNFLHLPKTVFLIFEAKDRVEKMKRKKRCRSKSWIVLSNSTGKMLLINKINDNKEVDLVSIFILKHIF